MKILPYILAGSARTGGAKSDYVFVFDIADPLLYLFAEAETEGSTINVTVEYLREGVKTTETYDIESRAETPIMPLADVNTPIRVTFAGGGKLYIGCAESLGQSFGPDYVSHVTSLTCTPHEDCFAQFLSVGSYPTEGAMRPNLKIKGAVPYQSIFGSTPETLDLSATSGVKDVGSVPEMIVSGFNYISAKRLILSKTGYHNFQGGLISDTLEYLEASMPFSIPVEAHAIMLNAPALREVRLTYLPNESDETDMQNWFYSIAAICVGVQRGVAPATGTFYINKNISDALKNTLETQAHSYAPNWTIVYE